MTISTGYAVANTQALAAIKPDQRTDGLMLTVKSDNNLGYASIYVYADQDNSIDDFDIVVIPDDKPAKGRWIKTGWGSNIETISSAPPSHTPIQTNRFYIESGSGIKNIYVSTDNKFPTDWRLISTSGWKIQSVLPYTCNSGDSIGIIVDGVSQGTVILPGYPGPGYSVNLINIADNTTLKIDPNGANYNGVVNRTIILNQTKVQITFLFTIPSIGWISTLDSALTLSP